MRADIAREVRALKRMTVGQLRDRYAEVFGEETRSHHKDYLWKRIAWRMQVLAEGDISEAARQRARELACDADLRTTAPKEFWNEPPAPLSRFGPLPGHCRSRPTSVSRSRERNSSGNTKAATSS